MMQIEFDVAVNYWLDERNGQKCATVSARHRGTDPLVEEGEEGWTFQRTLRYDSEKGWDEVKRLVAILLRNKTLERQAHVDTILGIPAAESYILQNGSRVNKPQELETAEIDEI